VLLKAGADKVSVNTAAVCRPDLVREAAEEFGSQCVVVAIDARRHLGSPESAFRWRVYTHGGRTETGLDAVDWARQVEDLGAGEILLTSMDKDGTRAGYDIVLTRSVAEAVGIPVIASGGAGSLDDFLTALRDGKADAVLAASLFHYRQVTIRQAKAYLRDHGVEVRL